MKSVECAEHDISLRTMYTGLKDGFTSGVACFPGGVEVALSLVDVGDDANHDDSRETK